MIAGKNFNIVDVNSDNVEQTGFFCFMSKRKAEGFQLKLQWLKQRFAEGMRIKMFELPERGFIEYIPGEYAWRAVEAEGYMMIHCLWVGGKKQRQRARRSSARRVPRRCQSIGPEGSGHGHQREGLVSRQKNAAQTWV